MKAEEATEYLREHILYFPRLLGYHIPVVLREDGLPYGWESAGRGDDGQAGKRIAKFSEIGVEVVSGILPIGWIAEGQYNFEVVDRVLHTVFEEGKAKYFVPRVKVDPPVSWCAAHPEDVCVYYEGPRDAEEIRALVGGPKHDFYGYDAPDGCYTAGGKRSLTRPNVGGVISNQSFSSDRWLADAGEALRRFIEYLENGPYGDRILAYHIAFGISGETMPWGRMNKRFGDYGVNARRKFYEWGLAKYGSEEAMREAWGDFGADVVPPPALRETWTEDCHTFRSFEKDRWSLDYDEFTEDMNLRALSHFAKIVKENTDGKAAGAFYGYCRHMDRAAYAGHLGWDKALACKGIDFFAAPKPYRRSGPGEPGGEMAPTVAVNRRKLWLDECDNRTHLTVNDDFENAKTPDETYTVHLREFTKNVSHNSGLWYMDLGGGWYDDDGIIDNIRRIREANDRIRKREHRSIAEILCLFDKRGAMLAEPKYAKWHEHCMRELQLAGAPIDAVLYEEAEAYLTDRVKLVVLQDPFAMGRAELDAFLAKLPKGCKAVWLGKCDIDLPAGRVIAMPIDTKFPQWREALEWAGVRCYAPAECAIYADNRVVGFYPRRDMQFEFELPGATLRNIRTGEEFAGKVSLDIAAKSCAAFEILA